VGSNHIWRKQTQSSIVIWWRPLKIQGAFEFCAPMDDALKVTGQRGEDFEVTAQRTLANGVRAWFDFMRTPLSPSYNTARYEREMGFKGIRLLIMLCVPAEDGVAATERLLRPAFERYRVEWPGNPGVEFHLSHGDWIRLLRRSGFEVEDLIEVRPAVGAISRYPFVTVEWARNWPCEEVWKARKTH
jgi:hypothetical protein